MRHRTRALKKPIPKIQAIKKFGTSASIDISKAFLFEHYVPQHLGVEMLGWVFVGLVVVLFIGKTAFLFLGEQS